MFKRTLLVFFVLIPVVAFGQGIFHVTTIDSFNATYWYHSFWGANYVNAIYQDGAIHFSFFYQGDSTAYCELMYGRRTSAGYEFDTVASFSEWQPGMAGSAINIDESGNPWVFGDVRHEILAYHRIDGSWVSSSIIDSSGYFKGIATVENSPDEIGLVYLAERPEGGMNSRVRYARWNGASWDIQTLFDDPEHGHFTRPSALKAGDDVYVSFAEGKDPDSIMVRVFRRSGGIWSEDFSDAYIASIGGVFMSERGVLGLSNAGQGHLWRQADQNSRYFIKTASGWESQPVIDPPGGFVKGVQGSNIQLSSDNTAFLLSEYAGFDPTISWRKADGTCGYNGEIPWYGYPCGITLQDHVITPDDTLHIFYTYGYVASPLGDFDPVVFREATVYVGDLLSGIEETDRIPATSLELGQNYPNPFQCFTTIQYCIREGERAKLDIYDIQGRLVKTLIRFESQAGFHTILWDGTDTHGNPVLTGIYFYRLEVSNGVKQTRKMLLLR